ncbi:hypothetical protein ACQR2L_19175 (plasmid) [Clostridium butyricum]|uniref:hypothetical protein n=1 Tax=Clostridium butyricum TaxID=1492 RepID=UPI003D0F0978
MEIHVTENAVNSLEVGLDFYNKFLENMDNLDISVSHFGNLKFAVVAIQNAIELLSKSILIDVNELIAFNLDIENDSAVCRMLRDQFDNKRKKAHIAYNAVFSTNNYKTIEYSKCIILIRKIFNDKVKQEDYNTLNLLGEYRNTLTHLGYASTFEWYKILIVLNDTLKLILEFFVSNIDKADKYFSGEIIDSIKNTLEISCEALPDLWMASHEVTLYDINKKLDDYFNDSIVVEEIKQDEEYEFYESITFRYEEDINLKWSFKYSYLNESIIIIDQNNKIVCFISLSDESLKYKKDENNIPTELKEFGIYIPKKLLEYSENMQYDTNSRNNTSKIGCGENNNVKQLINMYLKNCQ